MIECIVLLTKGQKRTPEDQVHYSVRSTCNEKPNVVFQLCSDVMMMVIFQLCQ